MLNQTPSPPLCCPFSSLISIMLNTGPVMQMKSLFKALISKFFYVNNLYTTHDCCEPHWSELVQQSTMFHLINVQIYAS